MNFNISGFTHKGTEKDSNQDCVLLNQSLLVSGAANLQNQSHCFCFVADGVGGNKAGDFASRYVLENIKSLGRPLDLKTSLRGINQQLLNKSTTIQELRGTATTLTGLIADEDTFSVVHAGDSQLWLFRNEIFFKVTNDQVFNDSDENSPITSYFGGLTDSLTFDEDIFVREINVGDTFLICSDGLFKSLNNKTVKTILDGDDDLEVKSQVILKKCLQNGADDNVSLVLIYRGE
jgi:PPM family protein phosphatase